MASTTETARRRTALITGASSGIGLELTKLFARDGYDLVLVARNREGLERLGDELHGKHGVDARAMPADLSSTSAVQDLVSALERDQVEVDALVNAAGFGGRGPFADEDTAEILGMLQVNVVALTLLTRAVLAGMVRRGSGKILNVASTAAFQPGPLMAVYYASKAYVLSLSEAIANEAAGTGVTVTALCPGPTATNFQARAAMTNSRLFNAGLTMQPDAVARAGYVGLLQGRRVVVPGLKNRLGALAARLAPSGVTLAATRRLNENREA